MLQRILSLASNELSRVEADSEDFKNQSQKCQRLFDELSSSLDENEKKKLLNLDLEYFMKAGRWKDDGFKEGLEKALN